MTKTIHLPFAGFLLWSGLCLHAQSSQDVTIVYDVQSREFVCWYEGARHDPACGEHSYGFYQGIHFYTGQAVYLQYSGAHIADLFVPTTTPSALAEPAVPVFGASVGLPSITKLIAPAESTALAPAVKPVATPRFELSNIPGLMDTLNKDEFSKLIQSALRDIVATDQAGKALAFSNSGALAILNQVTGQIPAQAQTIANNVNTLLGTGTNQLGWLRSRYCFPVDPAAGTPAPGMDFPIYNARLLDLGQLMSRQAALVQQAVAVDFKQKAGDVVAQIALYQDPAMGVFSASTATVLNTFDTMVRSSGYLQARSTIDQITIVGGQYSPANSLLAAVNAAAGGLQGNTRLGQLKDNLKYVVENFQAIDDAIQRYRAIAQYGADLLAYSANPNNVFRVQANLNEGTRLLVDAGAAANCVAQGMALPDPFDRPSIGIWYTSQTIALEIKRGTRLPAYDLSGIETTTQTTITRDSATPGAVSSAAQEASTTVAKTTFEVHNTYHFQLAAGFMRSWFHDVQYKVFQRTVTANGSNSTENFFAQTSAHNYRFLATADLIYYPFKREFFPWRARYPGERHPPFYKELGMLAGFSITDPTKDFFFGGAWVPRFGVGFQAGVHLGFVDRLPPVPLGQAITNDVTTISQKLDHGAFVGVVMHLQVFKDVFGAIFK